MKHFIELVTFRTKAGITNEEGDFPMRVFIVTLFLGSFLAMNAFGDALQAVDLRQIEAGGEIGDRIRATIDNNLLVMDMDKDFLQPFHQRKARSGYIGLGKTIDALVRFAAYSNDPRVLALKNRVVAEIIALQEADGYIGFFEPGSRIWKLWDIHEMAYILYGLIMDHAFFGNETALDAARKGADYIIEVWGADPDREPGGGEITVYMGVTGLETALLALHDATGEVKYRDFCADFRGLKTWDGPVVLGRWGQIQGHTYAYCCRALAQLRLHRLTPEEALLRPTRRAMDFLLKEDGLSVTGTCGQHECWHDTQEGAGNLGETCATAYLLRWWDEQLRQNGDALYGDLMERAIHNALFAAQSPDGRKIRYYAPFEGPRVYFDGDTYCCPCNYRRIVAELPQMIFYTGEDGFSVNLYTSAKATLTRNDGATVTMTQETDYPASGKVQINMEMDAPQEFDLRLRIPRWCQDAAISVNGEAHESTITPGEWLVLHRTWKSGDMVELEMPMALRLIAGRKAQAGRVAILYGPRVFCLNRAHNPALETEDLRLITIDPATLSGPYPDDRLRPGGLSCKVKAWRTTNWYPMARHDWELVLTEFPDPGGEAAYFHVPNPRAPAFLQDELIGP